jgi:urea transport system permease protein
MNTTLSAKAPNLLLAAVALFLVVIMPSLNAMGVVPDYILNTWGKYVCYAILAISVDLLWGYTGLLCLGQSLFFALGGYMLGMHLMLMIGVDPVYKSALPDFMDFLGLKTVPGFWKPFYSFSFAAIMVVVLPGLVAGIFGYLAFRSRIKGVYFSILTQALTYGAALIFFSNDIITMGGNNGFTDFRNLLGEDLRSPEVKRGLYLASAITLVLVFLLCKWLTSSRYGLIQRAIRDSENRVLFSGYSAANFKLFVFVISAMIAGIGGALYVPQVGIINPSEMMTEKSLEAVVWVAVGGRGTLIGPVVGAILVNYLKSWATSEYPDLWLIIMGATFVLVVLFLPKGIVGIPGQVRGLMARRGERKAALAEDELLTSAAKTK